MTQPRTPGSATALALAIGVCALALIATEVAARYVPHTWIQRDGRFYTNVNTTLIERASVDQGEFCASWYEGRHGWNRDLDAGWSNVAQGANGEHLPKHPILLPLLSTPFFWAFGLHGTLIFNVLVLALAGAFAFAFARRHASNTAAAIAAITVILATGIRDHAYDYHVDVLMLACFSGALALVGAKRGAWAGVLLGAAVVLRPTSLLWVPSIAAITLAYADRRTLWRGIAAASVPLLLFALSNWWLYGKPWWSGYNRVIIVVAGEPQVQDVSDAFGVPLRSGLEQLWSGPYGVRHRLTFVALALPGLVLLLRQRPVYVLATIAAGAASVLLFAKYRWYGDRFLWPSVAMLTPAIAASFDGLGRLLRTRPSLHAPLAGALATIAIAGVQLAVGGPLAERFGDEIVLELATRIVAWAAIGYGLTRAAERCGAGSLAAIAPVMFALVPGVRDRLLADGADAWVAGAVAVAVGVRSSAVALVAAAEASYIGATSDAAVDLGSLFARLSEGDGRAVAILLALAAVAVAARVRAPWLLLPLALLAIPSVAGLGHGAWPLFAIAIACVPLPALALRIAGSLHASYRGRPRRAAISVSVAIALLTLTGAAWRTREPPFRLASYRAVRSAEVKLGDIPCDFLAWEHLNWECATFDRGVHGETGLITSAPLHVGGRELRWFYLSTQLARPRTVRWDDVPASTQFAIEYAIADEQSGGGTLSIRVGDQISREITLPRAPDGRIHRAALDTFDVAGRRVPVVLTLRGTNAGVLVDGGFVHGESE